MSDAPHRLILASAGTGKTFQLTGHFLSLLVAGRSPERVLATTFTRKAAGEILDRVLMRLVRSVEDAEERARFGGEEFDADAAERLLERVARRLDRLAVRTLDSFFLQLVQLFALELDLSPSWRIVDPVEERRLKTQALARTLAAAPQKERVELLRGLQMAGAPREVSRSVLRLVDRGRAALLDSKPSAWHRTVPEGRLDDASLERACERLEAAELPKNSKGLPNVNWQKAVAKITAAARGADWLTVLDSKLAVACRDARETFYGSTVDGDLGDSLRPVVDHAIACAVAEIDRRDRSARDFLERFEAAYSGLKRERGACRFDDLPRFLSPGDGEVVLDERLADLWFRLDSRIDDVLLDEFQDTAPLQWRALEPLASEVLNDQGRTFFCVGDVKQSIYGWREAEPRLLAGLQDRYPQLDLARLTVSFRSSPVVLDAVDRLFEGIEEIEPFCERESFGAAAREFRAGYERHGSAKESMPGDVVVIEAVPREGEPLERALIRIAADRVRRIVDVAPMATVGVLVRRRRRIAALIHALREAGVRASGEGGNPLTDAEAVQVVLAAAHLADHPDDTVTAFHLATSPFGGALGLEPAAPDATRRTVAARLRERFVREGYGGVVSWFVHLMSESAAWSDRDRRRMRQLVEVALRFDERAGLRPSEFAEFVRATPVEDPEGAAVRVMTVHASKGLEFDAVVLPELDVPLLGGAIGGSIRTQRDDPYGPLTAVSMGFPQEIARCVPELEALRVASETRQVVDALCVLYVAVTRAARRLEMIVPPDDQVKRQTYARIVRSRFPGASRSDDGVVWRAESGSDDWHRGITVDEAPVAETPEPRGWTMRGGEGRIAPLRSPSAAEHQRADASALLARPREAARRWGSMVHRLFQQVEWLDGFDRSDDELLALLADIDADVGRRQEAVESFRAACRAPQIAALLTRPTTSGDVAVEAHCERPFAVLLTDDGGAEELWTGAFDRLVIRREGTGATAAEVIDFKTEPITADTLARRVDRYRPQLEAYRRVAAAITSLPLTAVQARLAFVSTDTVVSL